jgi:hypothetical protein
MKGNKKVCGCKGVRHVLGPHHSQSYSPSSLLHWCHPMVKGWYWLVAKSKLTKNGKSDNVWCSILPNFTKWSMRDLQTYISCAHAFTRYVRITHFDFINTDLVYRHCCILCKLLLVNIRLILFGTLGSHLVIQAQSEIGGAFDVMVPPPISISYHIWNLITCSCNLITCSCNLITCSCTFRLTHSFA